MSLLLVPIQYYYFVCNIMVRSSCSCSHNIIRKRNVYTYTYSVLRLKVYFFFVVFIYQKGKPNNYSQHSMFECLRCAEGCDECIDSSPCIASLNWVLRTIILVLSLVIIGCLPLVVFFTWKYGHLKVNLVHLQ